jgi:hypothetical protein
MATLSLINYRLHEVLFWAIIRLRKEASDAGGIYYIPKFRCDFILRPQQTKSSMASFEVEHVPK